MSISLQRLRYFHAIVSGGSFSSAARNLGIAQPALSYHIADMEKTLGAKLLVRSTRGVRLTESGTVLFRRADEVLRQMQDLEHEVRATASVPNGEVLIALAVTMARQLVPELFAIIDERYPRVRVKVLDVGSVPAMGLIQAGRVDVALVPNAAEMDDCDAEAVYFEPLVLISRRRGRRRDLRPIRFAEIADRPLVLAGRIYDLRRRAEEAAIVAGVGLNVRYEQDSQEIIRSIVLAGLASTISQTAHFDPESERPLLDIRPIVEPEITRTHAIVRRRDRAVTQAIIVVAEAIREAVARLVQKGIFPGRYIEPRPRSRN